MAYECRDGKDMYQVEYPGGRGIRWVHSFMIGGQYSDEKNAMKFRHEQRIEHERRLTAAAEASTTESADAVLPKPVIASRSYTGDALKCICQQAYSAPSEELITCSHCARKSHVKCVRSEGLTPAEQSTFQCPFCRLLLMDPFSPGFEILAFASTARNMNLPASAEGTVSMRFSLDPTTLKEWQSRRVAVSVRCVTIAAKQLRLPHGPYWPKDVTATVNAFRDVFKILPAKYGHVRREPLAKGVEDMLRPAANSISLTYSAPVDAAVTASASTQYGAPRFLFAVVAAEARGKDEILDTIRKLPLEDSAIRDLATLNRLAAKAAQLQSSDLSVESAGHEDVIKSRCPLSLCEIQTPVRGEDCEHLQPFDAESYVDVNMRLRNVEKRWRCPVCSAITRPEDLMVDSWAEQGMKWAREVRRGEALRLRLVRQGGLGSILSDFTAGGTLWELLPDEDVAGEGSEDEDESDTKRPRIGEGEAAGEVFELE